MRIFFAIFVALFVVGCVAAPAPFQCASSDPEFCQMEIKVHYELEKLRLEIKRVKFEIETNQLRCFAHGKDSFLCK